VISIERDQLEKGKKLLDDQEAIIQNKLEANEKKYSAFLRSAAQIALSVSTNSPPSNTLKTEQDKSRENNLDIKTHKIENAPDDDDTFDPTPIREFADNKEKLPKGEADLVTIMERYRRNLSFIPQNMFPDLNNDDEDSD